VRGSTVEVLCVGMRMGATSAGRCGKMHPDVCRSLLGVNEEGQGVSAFVDAKTTAGRTLPFWRVCCRFGKPCFAFHSHPYPRTCTYNHHSHG